MTDYLVSPEVIDAYNKDGAAVLRGVIDTNWLAKLSAAIERDIAAPGPYFHGYDAEDGRGRFHGNLRIWESDPDFRGLCFESGLAQVAQQFFASQKINLLYDQLFVKEPGTVNRTRWHNDQPYWPVRGDQVLSIWFSPDPVTAETGALEFVRGSHRWGRWFQPEVFGSSQSDKVKPYEDNPDYEAMPDIEAARGDYDIVSWDLEPGDAYVFHGLTVHGAGGNQREDVRRRGYTVRYTGDDAVYDSRPGTNEGLRDAAKQDGDPMDSDSYPRVI